MAKYGSADVLIYLIGGYSLVGYQTQVDYKKERLFEETTTLGDSWEDHELVGVARAELKQNGFYDAASGASNEAILALGAAFVAGLFGVAGNTYGRAVTMFGGVLAGFYERLVERAKLHKANAELTVSGRVYEGVVLAPYAAYALAASPLTAVDNGASSASGGVGVLEVESVTLGGYTSITPKIRHSSDNISYVDLITFTTVTGRTSEMPAAVAGTVNRYTHVTLTGVGAGSGESITMAVGFARL